MTRLMRKAQRCGNRIGTTGSPPVFSGDCSWSHQPNVSGIWRIGEPPSSWRDPPFSWRIPVVPKKKVRFRKECCDFLKCIVNFRGHHGTPKIGLICAEIIDVCDYRCHKCPASSCRFSQPRNPRVIPISSRINIRA